MKMHKLILAAAVACACTAATAAVTYDAARGTGTVGVSDVATAFGWNAKQTLAHADKVAFYYVVTNTYAGQCSWTTGAPAAAAAAADAGASNGNAKGKGKDNGNGNANGKDKDKDKDNGAGNDNDKSAPKVHTHRHIAEHTATTDVQSSLDAAGTTYTLGGLGTEEIEGDIPVKGEPCLGAGNDATWESVTLTGTTKELLATRGPKSKAVWKAPAAKQSKDD